MKNSKETFENPTRDLPQSTTPPHAHLRKVGLVICHMARRKSGQLLICKIL